MTTKWNEPDLTAIGDAIELAISQPARESESVTIWVVRVRDELFVRSHRGSGGRWFSQAVASSRAVIHAGGVNAEVIVELVVDRTVDESVNEAYRHKYRQFGSSYVEPMTAAAAVAATLRLHPST